MDGNFTKPPRLSERTAFEIYLRTGRIVGPSTTDTLQVKFNPWHDPQNGRFTFGGRGTYFGGGGASGAYGSDDRPKRRGRSVSADSPSGKFKPGGGSFGGGGATGDWSDSPPNPAPPIKPGGSGDFGGGGASGDMPSSFEDTGQRAPKAANTPALPRAIMQIQERPTPQANSATKPAAKLSPTQRVKKNGYSFSVSSPSGSDRRTEQVTGELQLDKIEKRSSNSQLQAGGADRRSTDHGGHFIGPRFNGPSDWFNHFAQDSNFNQSAYLKIENGWARDIKAGKRVFVDIVPHYKDSSRRPDKLTVRWTAGGTSYVRELANERKGK